MLVLIDTKKRGASLSLVPRFKGLRVAQSVETSNAESPTMMHIHIQRPIIGCYQKEPMRAVYKHPKGRSRCFVFDRLIEVAKFLNRQNQSVQIRLYVYCPTPLCPLEAFSVGKILQIYVKYGKMCVVL